MMRTTFAIVCLGLAFSPATADACSCAGPGSVCAAVGRADTVFVGRVVSVGASGGQVDLAVVEPLRGVQDWQVRINNGPGNCAYGFTAGESYLVYTYRTPDGQMWTSMCTRTRPVAAAAEDLAYLRSLAAIRPETPARVAGRVRLMDRFRATNDQVKPMPGIAVSATGEGRTFSATANERGEFVLNGLRLGAYDLTANVPQGYESSPARIEIHDPRGCGEVGLIVWYDGRVTGRVIDRNGSPIASLPLELVPLSDVNARPGERFHNAAQSNADGTFELRRVGPGEYVVALAGTAAPKIGIADRTFHPEVGASARTSTVTVGTGEQVRLPNSVMQGSLKLVTITGAVVDEMKQPVRDAEVMVGGRETEGGSSARLTPTLDSDGRFTFTLLEGEQYVVYVRRRAGTGPPQMGRTSFIAASGSPTVIVVVRSSRF